MIKVIVGLGNPGAEYKRTRHNAGFLFLERLAELYGAQWSLSKKTQSEIAEIPIRGRKVFLCKPQLFMNKSGLPVSALLKYYAINIDQMLVVHDDLELSAANVKMKFAGGHAGHNGIRDIIAQMNSPEFYRLRLGIGRPKSGIKVADYVLSNFGLEEFGEMDSAFDLLTKNFELLGVPDLEKVNALI